MAGGPVVGPQDAGNVASSRRDLGRIEPPTHESGNGEAAGTEETPLGWLLPLDAGWACPAEQSQARKTPRSCTR